MLFCFRAESIVVFSSLVPEHIVFLDSPNRNLNTDKTNWGFKLLVVRNMAALAGSAMLAQKNTPKHPKTAVHRAYGITWRPGDPSSWKMINYDPNAKKTGKGGKRRRVARISLCCENLWGQPENCENCRKLYDFGTAAGILAILAVLVYIKK